MGRGVLIALLLLPALCLAAQSFPRLDIPVRAGERTYAFPLAGGLNNPQLSAADLDGDGQDELYVFDRTGGVHLAFRQVEGAYVYTPELTARFPEMKNWVLLRDYNGDGAADLFGYSDVPGIDGIVVYQGAFDEEGLTFQRLTFDHFSNLLYFPLAGGPDVPVFVSSIDYPAVDDLDCDGDLDILTFNAAGGYIELYANQSVEDGYGLDSLRFRRTDDCWGGVFESGITVEVELSEFLGGCAGRLKGEEAVVVRHAGSTLLTLDGDGDGDRELILGDLSFSLVNYLHNAGTCQTAWIDRQEVGFPRLDRPADIDFFPAVFHLDLTGDGIRDLAVAPNARQEAENRDVLWLYENAGTEAAPIWNFRRSDLLAGEMLDLGSGAHPAFFDHNGDGLLDLLIGNGFRYLGPGQREAALSLWENLGTATEPVFALVDDNYLDVSAFLPGVTQLAPAFGDLDGDGDPDLLLGEEGGALLYAENRGGPNAAVDFAPWVYPFSAIDVGAGSAPAVADLNDDGLPDLIVGERDGNLNYFQNQGAPRAPFFDPDPEALPNTFVLGGVDTRVPGDFVGYSAPLIVEEGETELLITGSESGQLESYADLAANLYGSFNPESADWGGIAEGTRTHLALADINADGWLEAAVGNARGGLGIFRSDLRIDGVVSTPTVATAPPWRLRPNPFAHQLIAEAPKGVPLDEVTMQLYDLTGRALGAPRSATGLLTTLRWSSLPAGVYLLRIQSETYTLTKKVIHSP